MSRPAALGVVTRLSRAVDGAILWRLGHIPLAGDAPPAEPSDPAAFWLGTRVGSPARLRARPVAGTPAWARLGGGARPRLLELTGPSQGPGDHWGARNLRAWLALHPDPGAPVVLVLHGYAVPVPLWEERQMQLLWRRGMSAVRLELPFHLSRRPRGSRPGAGFFGSDPLHTVTVLRQAAEDAAAVAAWARTELGARVGVQGVSLGGLVGGLLAALTPLEAAALVTPACDLVSITLELAPQRLRRSLELQNGGGGPYGADAEAAREHLRERLAPVLLGGLRPRTAAERIVLVVAEHDRIVGAEPVRALGRAWGAATWEYPHGHVMVMSSRGLVARLHDHLARFLLPGVPEGAAAG